MWSRLDLKNIQKAIQSTFENAERFLKDSEILQENGSIGHATSLAILGYEEAQKAFELTKFHPLFSEFYTVEYLEELKAQLKDHIWKHIHAKQLGVSLEAIIASGGFSDSLLGELGFPSEMELQEATEFASSKNLDKMKNDGLYVDAFKDPFWTPSATTTASVEFALFFNPSSIIS